MDSPMTDVGQQPFPSHTVNLDVHWLDEQIQARWTGHHIHNGAGETVATYSWHVSGKGHERRILIPAAPPRWKGVTEDSIAIQEERVRVPYDENRHRLPRSPLDPYLCAIRNEQPNFCFNGIDLIADRPSLLQLLNVVQVYDEKRRCKPPLQFVAQAFGRGRESRVLLHELTAPLASKNRFLRPLIEACTVYDDPMLKNISHHRIVRARIGDLNVLVGHTVDAYSSKSFPFRTIPPDVLDFQARYKPTQCKDFPTLEVMQPAIRVERQRFVEFEVQPYSTPYPHDGPFFYFEFMRQAELWLSKSRFHVRGYYNVELDYPSPFIPYDYNPATSGDDPVAVVHFGRPYLDDRRNTFEAFEVRHRRVLERFAEVLRLVVEGVRSSCEASKACVISLDGDRNVLTIDEDDSGLAPQLSEGMRYVLGKSIAVAGHA